MTRRILFVLIMLTTFSVTLYAEEITRARRWEGSVRGCLGNSTVVERNSYGSKLPRLCTCLANFLVKKCAPLDSTSSQVFGVCAQKYTVNLLKLITPCVKAGREPEKNPYL